MKKIDNKIKYIVIGAGPAGLSLAHTFAQLNIEDYLIFDSGKDLHKRLRYDQKDAFQGLGGAGLYSDGKFSFYPAGTKVWELKNQNNLKSSYEILKNLFKSTIDFNINEFPDIKIKFEKKSDIFNLKKYPSYYLSLNQRKMLIDSICKTSIGKIKSEYLFESIKNIENDKFFNFQLTFLNLQTNEYEIFYAKYLIIGGGRFFPLNFYKQYKYQRIFRRYEFGVRLVGEKSDFECLMDKKYKEENLIDPKWIFGDKNKNDYQFKTFCICRDGETVLCNYQGIKAWSGRSDCNPTGFTNFGLNTVIYNEDYMNLNDIIKENNSVFEIKLNDILRPGSKEIHKYFNEKLGDLIIQGILQLKYQFQFNSNNIIVKGPVIEGVGYYPDIDGNLVLKSNRNIMFIGDSTGIFRGIIPSMISGIYVGLLLKDFD